MEPFADTFVNEGIMAIHSYRCNQFIPVTLPEAWHFFSSPKNLAVITPPEMNFVITSPDLNEKAYAGQIIAYKVSPMPLLRLTWVTEITHVNEPYFFVDEQRQGPYKLWHHQHHFEEVPGGVKMTDIVHYEVPLGFLGTMMNSLVIRKRIEGIFSYRKKKLEELFGTQV